MLALVLSGRTARRVGLPEDAVWDAGMFTLLAAFVLSRVLLVILHFRSFVQFPLLLLAVPSLTPAGLGLTVLASLGWMRWKGLPVLRTLDAWAPCATLVWAALAVGHYAEGSDPGMAVSSVNQATHPIALYAALLAFALTAGLYGYLRRERGVGETAAGGLAAAGTMQFLLSFLRAPDVVLMGETAPLLDPLQWVSLGMVVAGGCLLAWAKGYGRGRLVGNV